MVDSLVIEDTFADLIKKISSKKAIVGIVGLGYVGLPIAATFAKKKFKTIGFDTNNILIQNLSSHLSHIKAVSNNDLKSISQEGFFSAVSDLSKLKECDALIICVPTPLDSYSSPDLRYVISSVTSISNHLRKGQLISLESTTYPGTTLEVILPILQQSNLEVGRDFFLAYSPEREDPGNTNFHMAAVPKIVSGHTNQCLEVASLLYSSAVEKVIKVSSTKVAEMAKLLENIYRCVNISMINEMKIIADSMDINILEVIDAAATKPFGFTPFYPGPGIGGHCIPVDPFYLTYKAKQFGIHTRFIELAGEINYKVQNFVVRKTILALNEASKSLKNSKILALGVAYKKNVEDMRESPSVNILKQLRGKGAILDYHDPLVSSISLDHDSVDGDILLSKQINPQMIASYDLILLLTDHDSVDYDMILENAKLIIDTRGRYKSVGDRFREKVLIA